MVDTELLIRYLTGQGSRSDVDAAQRWLAGHPAHAETLAALADALHVRPHLRATPNADAAWQQLSRRLVSPSPAMELVRDRSLGRRSRAWVPITAAAALLVVAAAGWWSMPAARTRHSHIANAS